MQLITLNTWGGRVGAELLKFIADKQASTDIFCLQEIYNGGHDQPAEQNQIISGKQYDLYAWLVATMPEHQGYFEPCLGDWYGLATFIRESLSVLNQRSHFVHGLDTAVPVGDLGYHSRIILTHELKIDDKILHVVNFNGLWNGQGKGDSEARLKQSQAVIEYLKTLSGEIILCGDFNLGLETESLKMFEAFGLRNLVREYKITSTRTERYPKPDKFADYIFTTPGIKIENFQVLPDNVSDHAALQLNFNLA